MPPGDSLRMVHNREPFPLYGILQQDGYQYRTETCADGHFEIVIWRNAPASSLSLEQAPPISVPFLFFLSAPLFLLLAAALVLVSGPQALESRWTPALLALTHLITLGFLSMTMIGALMQQLPVVAGAPMRQQQVVAWLVHIPLLAGTLILVSGCCVPNQLYSRNRHFPAGVCIQHLPDRSGRQPVRFAGAPCHHPRHAFCRPGPCPCRRAGHHACRHAGRLFQSPAQ